MIERDLDFLRLLPFGESVSGDNLIPCPIGGGASIQAVYLDDQMSGWNMYNNTIINTEKGIFIGGGRRNIAKNNYCENVNYCMHLDNRGMNWQQTSCNNTNTSSLWQGLYSVNYQNPPSANMRAAN